MRAAFHAYVKRGTPAGTDIVWAKRLGERVSARDQDGFLLGLFGAEDFDNHFRPTADDTKENA